MNRIKSLYTKTTATAAFALVLTLAGFANAATVNSNNPHKGKKVYFTISSAVEVGGTTLQPGDYSAREVNTPKGPVMEFTHIWFNYLAQDFMQHTQYDVVARVPVTEQALNSKPKQTKLVLASNSKDAVGLEIRGNAVDYEFAPSSQTADKVGE
jgi:hypothetical protein